MLGHHHGRRVPVIHIQPGPVDRTHQRLSLIHIYTTNPDDWAKISGKKGERIVYVRTLVSHPEEDEPEGGRAIERVQTGQYL